MEELNGVTIYWLISIGLLVGLIMDLMMGNRGVSLVGNLAGGVIGSVIVGLSVMFFDLFAPLIYATLGSIAFLFLVNIFRFEPEEKQDARVSGR